MGRAACLVVKIIYIVVLIVYKIMQKVKTTFFSQKLLTNRFYCDIIPFVERKTTNKSTASLLILPNCVKVARQTLTLFVWVRILVRQPKNPTGSSRWDFFIVFGYFNTGISPAVELAQSVPHKEADLDTHFVRLFGYRLHVVVVCLTLYERILVRSVGYLFGLSSGEEPSCEETAFRSFSALRLSFIASKSPSLLSGTRITSPSAVSR